MSASDATFAYLEADLDRLEALLQELLDRLDFRSENIRSALAKMAQHAERTIRRLMT